jgi:hypothetical protein
MEDQNEATLWILAYAAALVSKNFGTAKLFADKAVREFRESDKELEDSNGD